MGQVSSMDGWDVCNSKQVYEELNKFQHTTTCQLEWHFAYGSIEVLEV